jgi:signal transduction histidine kinase
MKFNLGAKIFLSYLLVLLVGLLVLAAVAQVSLPGAYGRHAAMMNGTGMMGGNGRGPAAAAGGVAFVEFRQGFYEALAWAGLAALAVAGIVSLFISRGLVAPIKAMRAASQRVADGHYSERVPWSGSDELGELAGSFNTMAEKLEKVETLRRRLIGDVAHELRTPLTAIKGSMEGLVDGILPASPETFEQVAAEADRLSRLVDDLQEISRVEAGAINLDLQVVSLSDLVEAARKRLGEVYKAKGVHLDIRLSGRLPLVQGDKDRLLQVLINLLNNSLQYTPAGGTVTISGERQGRDVTVQVTDTGIGIPPEHLPFIFDRFYRVDSSRSRRGGGGSGIGLTISKYLVEAHGGRIWAVSPGEGQGSTFSFTIPAE